jgi:uncharacterized protein (DUF58 family)
MLKAMEHPAEPSIFKPLTIGARLHTAWPHFRERLRQLLRPPRQLKITRFGWAFLLVTIGLGLAAINSENNLMYLLLGLLLGFIVASGLLSEMSLRALDISAGHPSDPVAGKPFLYEIAVHNKKRRLPSFAVMVEELAADGMVIGRAFFFRVAAAGTAVQAVEGLYPRRGRVLVSGFRLATRFPFGLFEKSLAVRRAQELIFLPDAEGAAALPAALRLREGHAPAGRQGAGAELYAIRPWQSRDSLRSIHWRKSAAGAGLQTKIYEREERPQMMLAMVPGGQLGLEDAVCVAARWVVEMERIGYEVGLVAGESILPGGGAAHRLALLRALALFTTGPAPVLQGSEVILPYAASA